MNKPFLLFLLLALLLSACQPAGAPIATFTPPPPATAVSAPTQAPAPQATATLAPTPLPTSTQAPSASPTTAPQATAGAGGAAAFKDCTLLPGLAACGGKLPLSGKLALVDAAGQRLVVVDFKAGTAWQQPFRADTAGVSFSPSGKQVLFKPVGAAQAILYDAASGQELKQLQLSGTLTWTPQDALVSPPFRTVWSAAGDQAWIDFNTGLAHLRFASQADKDVTWPISTAPSDRIAQAVAWVPKTDLMLFEQHFGGNSMWTIGGTLSTLNVKNGAIMDLQANMSLAFHFQWQPAATGVMVYGDTADSPVMGGQNLYVLNVVSGSRTAVALSSQVNVSAPAFTPDGQSILFGAALLPNQPAAGSPFVHPAIYLENPAKPEVHAVTQPPDGFSDTQPQLLPDGTHFLFFRGNRGTGIFSLHLGSLAGDLDLAVTADLPLASTQPDLSFDSVLVYQP